VRVHFGRIARHDDYRWVRWRIGNSFSNMPMGRSLSVKRGVALKLDLSSFQSANEIPEGVQHFVRSFQLSAFKIVTNLLVIGLMRWFIGQLSVVF
jgi:hypothetical protein